MTKEQYEEYVQSKIATPIECSLLGLAGEVGELLDTIKKYKYHGHEKKITPLKFEAGDILFYLSDIIVRELGLDLNTVMLANKEKLDARYKDKFTQEESVNRVKDT